MAKLTAPLLSFDARGAIGKTLVFIGWKGIKTVRQFVIPANPNTVAQALQRSFMRFSVAYWKILVSVDKLSWNSYAAILSTPLSGFNAMTRESIASLRALDPTSAPMGKEYSLTPQSLSADVSIQISALQDDSDIDGSSDFDVLLGTDVRDMTTKFDLTQAGGGNPYTVTATGLTANVVHFMQIVDSVNGNKMSGIQQVTPTA